jgi:hypothetical protein
MTEMITMDAIMKMLQEITGFGADATQLDAVRVVLEAKAASMAESYGLAPAELTDAHLHSLVTLAHQVLDSALSTDHFSAGAGLVSALASLQAQMDSLARTVLAAKPDVDLTPLQARMEARMDALTRAVAALQPAVPYIPLLPVHQSSGDYDTDTDRLLAAIRDQKPPQPVSKPGPPKAAAKDQAVSAPALQKRPGCFYNDDGTISCKTCGKPKDTSEYYRDRQSATGYKSACQDCERAAKGITPRAR